MTGAQRIIGGTTSALAFRVGNARKARTVPYGSSTSLDWFGYVNTMCVHIRTISSLRVLKIEHRSLSGLRRFPMGFSANFSLFLSKSFAFK